MQAWLIVAQEMTYPHHQPIIIRKIIMTSYEEQMPWMLAQAMDELGLTPKKVDDKTKKDPVVKKQAQPAVNREPRDVSWYRRGEECPH